MQIIDMIVTSPYDGREGRMQPGAEIRVTEERARYLKQKGLAEPCKSGPAETKPAGPQETKRGNSSGAPMIGPSTDLPSSSAPGGAAPALSSVADPASALRPLMRVDMPGVRRTRRGSAQLQ